jgi:predicted nucleotidyltransferase
MRLSDIQIQNINSAILQSFENVFRIVLFGSRVNDKAKGGDIDLLVITDQSDADAFRSKIKALTKMVRTMGERKIDLITAQKDSDDRFIVKEALMKGVDLWKKT